MVDTINYTLPANDSVTALPATIKIVSKYGEYQVHFSQQGQPLQVIKQLKIISCKVNPSEYPDFYTFYNGIMESEKSLYITLNQH
jgi:hypothetical protein